MARIFVGMETSGMSRRAFQALGHQVVSCDTLPAEDGAPEPDGLGRSGHLQGDVFETLRWLDEVANWRPDAGLFHPTCTTHTVAAAWAFKDPDFVKYPGVGYHQRVQPGTLVGKARRDARAIAEEEVERIADLPFFKVIENPKGTLPTRTTIGAVNDVLQPYEFGHDASKATCIWAFNAAGDKIGTFPIRRDPALYISPTLRPNGKSYWANQTDTGQNNISPGDERWKDRSRTYPGIAEALAAAITAYINRS